MLAKHVDFKTVMEAGFNHYSPSVMYEQGNYFCNAYISHTFIGGTKEVNLFVIEAKRKNNRIDWYFGIIEGPDRGEISETGVGEYDKQLSNILTRKNRVAARDLQKIILETIGKI